MKTGSILFEWDEEKARSNVDKYSVFCGGVKMVVLALELISQLIR